MKASLAGNKTAGGQPQNADVNADRAIAYLGPEGGDNRTLKKIELFDNVHIDSRQADGKPTKIDAGYALYEKQADRFELKNGLHIVTIEDENPTDIKAANGVYEQAAGRISLNGNAEITQGPNFVRGDTIFAELFANKKLKQSRVTGNAYVKQAAAERTTEVNGPELNAKFGEDQKLLSADVTGAGSAILTPAKPVDYTKMTMSAANAINVAFKKDGILNNIATSGRTTVQLDVPNNTDEAASKRLTADTVKTVFNDSGQDMKTAEAS